MTLPSSATGSTSGETVSSTGTHLQIPANTYPQADPKPPCEDAPAAFDAWLLSDTQTNSKNNRYLPEHVPNETASLPDEARQEWPASNVTATSGPLTHRGAQFQFAVSDSTAFRRRVKALPPGESDNNDPAISLSGNQPLTKTKQATPFHLSTAAALTTPPKPPSTTQAPTESEPARTGTLHHRAPAIKAAPVSFITEPAGMPSTAVTLTSQGTTTKTRAPTPESSGRESGLPSTTPIPASGSRVTSAVSITPSPLPTRSFASPPIVSSTNPENAEPIQARPALAADTTETQGPREENPTAFVRISHEDKASSIPYGKTIHQVQASLSAAASPAARRDQAPTGPEASDLVKVAASNSPRAKNTVSKSNTSPSPEPHRQPAVFVERSTVIIPEVTETTAPLTSASKATPSSLEFPPSGSAGPEAAPKSRETPASLSAKAGVNSTTPRQVDAGIANATSPSPGISLRPPPVATIPAQAAPLPTPKATQSEFSTPTPPPQPHRSTPLPQPNTADLAPTLLKATQTPIELPPSNRYQPAPAPAFKTSAPQQNTLVSTAPAAELLKSQGEQPGPSETTLRQPEADPTNAPKQPYSRPSNQNDKAPAATPSLSPSGSSVPSTTQNSPLQQSPTGTDPTPASPTAIDPDTARKEPRNRAPADAIGFQAASKSREATPTTPLPHTAKSPPTPGSQPLIQAWDRMRSDGQSRISIEIRLSDTENVRVQIQIRQDRVQATFSTSSEQARLNIQQGWEELTQRFADRGARLDAPQFSNSQSPTQQGSREHPNSGSEFHQNHPDHRGNRPRFQRKTAPGRTPAASGPSPTSVPEGLRAWA